MGLRSSVKGKAYERLIAAELRRRWPEAIVRRASQAERADNPDVFVEGGPSILARLWLEMQDSKTPTPLKKLRQAEDDIEAHDALRGRTTSERLPVVVWHRIKERTSQVTTRLWVIGKLTGWTVDADLRLLGRAALQVVTLDVSGFLDLVEVVHS